MTDQAEPRRITRTHPALTRYDLQETILALRGIFAALDWIGCASVHDVDDTELANASHELAIAGRLLASRIADEF